MRAFLLLACLSVPGCGCFVPVDDCGGQPCPAPKPVSPDPVAQLLIDVVRATTCEQQKACGVTAPQLSCDALMWGARYALQPGFADFLAQAADAGRVTIDLDGGAACLAQLRTTCGAECWPAAALTGRVALGGTCDQSLECVPGSYCRLAGACPGRCTKKSGDGAGVDDRAACWTLSFATLTDGGVRCLERIPEGGPCASRPDETQPTRACVPGSACTNGTCAWLLKAGDACAVGFCGPGLDCVGGKCVPRANVGGACPCLDGLACLDGVCALPRAREGEPCDPGGRCAFPAVCERSGRCGPRGWEGDPCRGNTDCGPYWLSCVGGVCAAPLREGAACDSNGACGPGLGCTSGQCARTCGG